MRPLTPELWADELNKWLGAVEADICIMNSARDFPPPSRKYNFLITSYNYMEEIAAMVAEASLEVVVLDESHYIKSNKVTAASSLPGVQQVLT